MGNTLECNPSAHGAARHSGTPRHTDQCIPGEPQVKSHHAWDRRTHWCDETKCTCAPVCLCPPAHYQCIHGGAEYMADALGSSNAAQVPGSLPRPTQGPTQPSDGASMVSSNGAPMVSSNGASMVSSPSRDDAPMRSPPESPDNEDILKATALQRALITKYLGYKEAHVNSLTNAQLRNAIHYAEAVMALRNCQTNVSSLHHR